MSKISVIIPVYNVESYLARCLDSILAQTFTDFDIICVDDGSTDASGSICEQYAEKDSRVKVYHIENNGVGNARNYALSKLESEWYTFVDSDDWIEPDYLKILYEMALENNCEISACSFQRNTAFSMGYERETVRTVLINGSKDCIHNFICPGVSLQGMSTNKLYRTDLFGDIRFDVNIKVNEDCLYTYAVMKRCEKACLTTAPMYHWFIRQDSASHSKKVTCDFSAANVFLYLYEETESLKDEAVTKTLQKNYIGSVLKVFMYADYDRTDACVKEARERCRQWRGIVWSTFDVKAKLKYILAFHIKWVFH